MPQWKVLLIQSIERDPLCVYMECIISLYIVNYGIGFRPGITMEDTRLLVAIYVLQKPLILYKYCYFNVRKLFIVFD